ncbi:DUF5131 family protein [Terriglobus albidus]|uniref:DUF5131 family protein n=1 Tax=Terriglobus albidus TaxID=1592106 RepID=UPI0021DF5C30|nr:phage Gp37/Gp68 family protein [Terriglobus albidus]
MSNIEWTGETWNPIAGCTPISPGCVNCYAKKMAHRLALMGQTKYQGLTILQGKHAYWTGKIAEDRKDKLVGPLARKKRTIYFVNSMSDLFHESVTDEQIDRIFAVMALTPQHTYQVLTKRADRMLKYLSLENPRYTARRVFDAAEKINPRQGYRFDCDIYWPLDNVWLGVSVENQHYANLRIPDLLRTPAAVRFISAEPLIEQINLDEIELPSQYNLTITVPGTISALTRDHEDRFYQAPSSLDWVIVGGESGVGARPFNVEWAYRIVQQCKSAGVPVFVKQMGAKPYQTHGEKPYGLWSGIRTKPVRLEDRLCHTIGLKHRKGGLMSEWPEAFRVRQMPEVARG